MNIDDLTLGQLKSIQAMGAGSPDDTSHFPIGEAVVIRTVTMHYIGRLVAVTPKELVLEEAGWLANSGRWHSFLTGAHGPKEFEPYPDGRVIVGRGALIDCCLWGREIPRSAV